MWISGGSRSGSSSVPTRTKRTGRPLRVIAPQRDPAGGAADDLLTLAAVRGVATTGSPLRTTTRSASIIALSANDAPVSRWHQRQWQMHEQRRWSSDTGSRGGAASFERKCSGSVIDVGPVRRRCGRYCVPRLSRLRRRSGNAQGPHAISTAIAAIERGLGSVSNRDRLPLLDQVIELGVTARNRRR